MKINPQFSPEPPLVRPADFGLLPNPQVSPGVTVPSPHEIGLLVVPLGANLTGLFPLGTVMASEGVRAKLCPRCVGLAIKSHHDGQWGHVSKWDALANEQAVIRGDRKIISKFRGNDAVEFIIITEADRSVTVILLPEEL